MSVTINLENFQSWSEIFTEIKRQRNLKVFSAIQPDIANIQHQERKPRTFSAIEARQVQDAASEKEAIGRRHSQIHSEKEAIGRRPSQIHSRLRPRKNSTPCPATDLDTDILQHDSRLTEAAQKLSKEQMVLLYEDILKPLDIFSIVREQRAQIGFSQEMFQ